MKLSDMLSIENIIPDLKAKDKRGVLEELAKVLSEHEPNLDKDTIVKGLLEREKLGTTGIGDGVAIPHGKFQGISHPIVSIGRSKKGLDFDAMDGRPVHLFFLLLAPENEANLHLKALAQIARIARDESIRHTLMESNSRESMYRAVMKNDTDL
jgi:PTS system nitrogen regulatory IIA component